MNDVYLMHSDSTTTSLKRIHCKNEDAELQQLLEKNLNLLPGDQFGDKALRWLLIKREMPVGNPASGEDCWLIDFLLVDQDAVPTFVECKRHNDTRARREVVGQMLEYAANGRHYWDGPKLHLAAQNSAGGEESLRARLSALIGDSAPEDFFAQMEQNLRESKIRLVLFLEDSPHELRSIVEFLNGQMKDTEIFLVEARQYEQGNLKIVAPWVFGYTEEARIVKQKSKAEVVRNLAIPGEEAFWLDLEKNVTAEDWRNKIRRFIDWAEGVPGCVVTFRRVCLFYFPSLLPKSYLFGVWRNGNLEIPVAAWGERRGFILNSRQKHVYDEFLLEAAAIGATTAESLRSTSYKQFEPEVWLPNLERLQALILKMANIKAEDSASDLESVAGDATAP